MSNDDNTPTISKKSLDAIETAQRYIIHVGMNKLMRGEPHPQELALDELQDAIYEIQDAIGVKRSPHWREDIEPWFESHT